MSYSSSAKKIIDRFGQFQKNTGRSNAPILEGRYPFRRSKLLGFDLWINIKILNAHHLRFKQTSGLSRKVSDQFTVRIWRGHSRRRFPSGIQNRALRTAATVENLRNPKIEAKL
jgi:hypothetical protein